MGYHNLNRKLKILIIACAFPNQNPWWYRYVEGINGKVEISIARVPEVMAPKYKVLLQLLKLYIGLNKYDIVITEQDGYATFLISFLNSLLRFKKYKHVVFAFITRECDNSTYSKLKYKFLHMVLSTIDKVICMSKHEISYYSQQIKLPQSKFSFCPFFIDPNFLSKGSNINSGYIFSGGRTGRDYKTLIEAVKGMPVNLYIVAGKTNLHGLEIPDNVRVYYDISLNDMTDLMARSAFVVIPLQDREISIGQTVVLQAMAMGKAVIASNVFAMQDYITEGIDGLLVPPDDVGALKNAIKKLLADSEYSYKLGASAIDIVKRRNLPHSAIKNICKVISEM